MQGILLLSLIFLAIHGVFSCQPPCLAHYKMATCNRQNCTAIPRDLPHDLVKLELQKNKITEINKGDLDNYENLTTLLLQSNDVVNIENGAFNELGALQTLQLGFNRIEIISFLTFTGLQYSLKSIDLSGNNIKHLGTDVFTFTNVKMLTTLHLGNNLISSMDHDAITELKFLHTLDLSYNHLKSVGARHFTGLPALQNLNLQGNELVSIGTGTFRLLENLASLSLSANDIKDIHPAAFDGLDQLHTLVLSHNKLTEVPSFTSGLKSLHSLNLDYNAITAVNFSEHILPSLTSLSLCHLKLLRRIHSGTLTGFQNLTELHLSYNPKLFTINVDAFSHVSTTLRDIYINNNALETLDKKMLNWEYLTTLDLSANPWRCDCHLEWMKELSLPHTNQHNVKCHAPESLKNQLISKVPYSKFICPQRTGSSLKRGLVVGLLSAGLVVLVLGCVCFTYAQRTKIFPCLKKVHGRYVTLYDARDPLDEPTVNIQEHVTQQKGILKNPAPVHL